MNKRIEFTDTTSLNKFKDGTRSSPGDSGPGSQIDLTHILETTQRDSSEIEVGHESKKFDQ